MKTIISWFDPMPLEDSDLPDITLGEACEEIRELHKAGERLRAENERLQRERDEAIAEAKFWRGISVLSSIDGMIEEIEKQARAKAIEEAAAVARLEPDFSMKTEYQMGYERGRNEAATAILALLKDKP